MPPPVPASQAFFSFLHLIFLLLSHSRRHSPAQLQGIGHHDRFVAQEV
jgi:hypothetical protein